MNNSPAGNYKADILIVDDTPDNLRLLSNMLQSQGYRVRKAINGQIALNAAQLSPPDLILLDINMPIMNGYQVCEQLKTIEITREIPVIFLSALNEVADKIKAFQVGGVDYITKPFQVEEVLTRIEKQLTTRSLYERLQEYTKKLEEQNLRLQAEIRDRQRTEEDVRFLLNTTRAIAESVDFHSTLDFILRYFCETMGWDVGETWIPNDEKMGLKYGKIGYVSEQIFLKFKQQSQRLELAPNIGLGGRVWLSKKSKWIEDFSSVKEPDFVRHEIAASVGLKAGLGVPILVNDRVVAVLVFLKRSPVEKEQRLLDLVNAVAMQLGSLIQRKQSQEETQTVTRNLQEVQKIAHIGNWEMDVRTQAIAGSEEMFRIFGLNRCKTLTFDQQIDRVHPEDTDVYQNTLAQAIAEGKSYEMDFRIIRSDGEIRHLKGKGEVQQSESGEALRLLSTAMDITERKRLERQLAVVEARFNAFFAASSVGLSIVDDRLRFVEINETLVQMYGLNVQSDYRGKTLADVLPEIAPEIEPFYQQVLTTGVPVFNVELSATLPNQSGIERYFKMSYFPILGENDFSANRLSDRPLTVGTVVMEITDRKQAEAALRQSEMRERQTAEELEQTLGELNHTQTQLMQHEKMASLGQLVAGIAHEINNPVNFIYGNLSPASEYIWDLLGLVELYQQNYPQPLPEIQNEINSIELDYLVQDLPRVLNSMKMGALRIKEIVQSLRTFSRVDEVDMKAVNLHDNIESTLIILLHRLQPKSDRPAIQVIKEYGNLPKVQCYPGQLNQVFMNLLSNAIDALDGHGGVACMGISDISKRPPGFRGHREEKHVSQIDDLCLIPSAQFPTIRISTTAIADHCVLIRISDNGIGMTGDVMDKIYDPFYTTKPVGKGTGLGLAISYKIIEKHQGKLTCFSERGKGTEFVLQLPLKQGVNLPKSEC